MTYKHKNKLLPDYLRDLEFSDITINQQDHDIHPRIILQSEYGKQYRVVSDKVVFWIYCNSPFDATGLAQDYLDKQFGRNNGKSNYVIAHIKEISNDWFEV